MLVTDESYTTRHTLSNEAMRYVRALGRLDTEHESLLLRAAWQFAGVRGPEKRMRVLVARDRCG
jgi:hypothetical protein